MRRERDDAITGGEERARRPTLMGPVGVLMMVDVDLAQAAAAVRSAPGHVDDGDDEVAHARQSTMAHHNKSDQEHETRPRGGKSWVLSMEDDARAKVRTVAR